MQYNSDTIVERCWPTHSPVEDEEVGVNGGIEAAEVPPPPLAEGGWPVHTLLTTWLTECGGR